VRGRIDALKRIATLLVLTALPFCVVAGCGGDDGDEAGSATTAPDAAATSAGEEAQTPTGAEGSGNDPREGKQDEPAEGTEVVLGDSEFGEMLYDANDQAIYVFERDTSEKSVCYDECAAAWPPVVTSREPVARAGVDASLLGTTERRDGKLQVTYGGKPLYYYAHEAPGEVRCHNVDLNGGFWWVVGADGEPLA
jgi:predicted lipoprotein with Yx(FWY)xxD motif